MSHFRLAINFFVGNDKESVVWFFFFFNKTALSVRYDCGFVGYFQRESFLSGKEVVTKKRTVK